MRTWLLLALALCLSALPASAQTPPVANPSSVEFSPSPNHNDPAGSAQEVTRYTLDIAAQSTPAVVVKTVDLGKPPSVAGKVTFTGLDAVMGALPVGNYVAIVKAEGPGGVTASVPSDPFAVKPKAPGAPGKPVWRQ